MASKKKAQFDAIFADETADLSPFALLGIQKGRGSDVTVDRKPRLTVDRQPQPSDITSEGRLSPVTSDGQTQPEPTVIPMKTPPPERQPLPLTSDGQTQPVRHNYAGAGVPLAPIQWSVWQHLKDNPSQVFNYQSLSEQLHIKPRSIKQAVQVLKTVGLVTDQTIVRTRTTQGFSVSINENGHAYPVNKTTAHKIATRSDVTSYGRPSPVTSDPVSLYKIIHTYREILKLFPAAWSIREQILKDIARALPEMTSIEFKASCRFLIEQGKNGPKVRHHGAWLKAAFEKAGGPLVSEADIEAQLAGNATPKAAERPMVVGQGDDADIETLQRYMAATAEERAEIDQLATEKAKPALAGVGDDKHDGIMLQAKIEAAREYFHSQETKG